VKEDLTKLKFMNSIDIKVDNILCCVTRCGYSGEDGFEVILINN
jgi:glycine cleavage system aminomethyltransferase T